MSGVYKPTNMAMGHGVNHSRHLLRASFQRLPCSAPLTFQSVLSKMAATGLLSRNKLLQVQNKYSCVIGCNCQMLPHDCFHC